MSILYKSNEQIVIEIKKLMLEKQISQREISDRLSIKPQGLTKLLGKKNFGFEDAQKILTAMGYDLIIDFKSASDNTAHISESYPTAAALGSDQRPEAPKSSATPAAAPEPQEAAAKKESKEFGRLPLTPENIAKVDLDRLTKDFRYQLDVGDAFGMESLAKLLDMARQRKPEKEVPGADQ